MRILAVIIAVLLSCSAGAQTINNLGSGSALSGSEKIPMFQTANPAVTTTPGAIATYIESLISGDCTITGNVITCTKTGGVAFGTFATQSVPTGSTQCLHANSAGVVSGTGSDCGSGSGAVSSVSGGAGITVSPTTGSVVVSAPSSHRDNTTTSDTLANTDAGLIVTENNSSAVAVSIAQAGTTGFANNTPFTLKNLGAGLVTLTPTTSTIGGKSAWVLSQGQSLDFYSDGTNYQTVPGPGIVAGSTVPNILGTVTTQSGTTYTFASTDCGTEVTFSNASAVTATIPATLPAGCTIAIAQLGAGKVSVNGSAVSAATLHSAHSYTGTSAQYAVINVNIEANSGGSSAIALLTGDGS